MAISDTSRSALLVARLCLQSLLPLGLDNLGNAARNNIIIGDPIASIPEITSLARQFRKPLSMAIARESRFSRRREFFSMSCNYLPREHTFYHLLACWTGRWAGGGQVPAERISISI
jgi:hypothetical protein